MTEQNICEPIFTSDTPFSCGYIKKLTFNWKLTSSLLKKCIKTYGMPEHEYVKILSIFNL